MKLLIAVCAACLLTGCARYQSYIKSTEFGELRLPKDSSWDSLTYVRHPDGRLELSIINANFKMNPAVIDAETAQLKMMMEQLYNAGLAAGKAAATGGVSYNPLNEKFHVIDPKMAIPGWWTYNDMTNTIKDTNILVDIINGIHGAGLVITTNMLLQ